MQWAGHEPQVLYGAGGCVWYKAVVYREQVHFVEIKDMSMGVRGVSAGMPRHGNRHTWVGKGGSSRAAAATVGVVGGARQWGGT